MIPIGFQTENTQVSLITKLYVWSVVLEPLLFFIIWDEWITGVGGNLSRMLQASVLMFLIVKKIFIKPSPFRIINYAHPFFRNYSVYFGIAIFAGIISSFSGVYDIPALSLRSEQSHFAGILNSAAIRPLFEYVIALYYFIYFTVMPRYMLTNDSSVRYFFSVFKITFVISFIVGVADIISDLCGYRLVPCHIANWPQWAGTRFHGLAGEPRDAFVYLFLGMAVLHLDAHIRGKSLSPWWVVAICTAAILAQSASGLIGIVVFVGLFLTYNITQAITVRRAFFLLAVLILTPALIYGTAAVSKRLTYYLKSTNSLWDVLESGGKLPVHMEVQSANIYPLYDLTV
nr:hypothetical protein [Smithellaceae bacterium]